MLKIILKRLVLTPSSDISLYSTLLYCSWHFYWLTSKYLHTMRRVSCTKIYTMPFNHVWLHKFKFNFMYNLKNYRLEWIFQTKIIVHQRSSLKYNACTLFKQNHASKLIYWKVHSFGVASSLNFAFFAKHFFSIKYIF